MKRSNVPFEIGASVASLAIQLAKLYQKQQPVSFIDEAIALIERARERIEMNHGQE
jgi:hypothetical protein